MKKNDDTRKGLSDSNNQARFTAPAELSEMDEFYPAFIKNLIEDIHKTRISVVLQANSSMMMLYWKIGNAILEKQKSLGWGAKVIDRISYDLKKNFPEMKGFSPRNIK